MRSLLMVVLLSSSSLLAQTPDTNAANQQKPAETGGKIKIEGCVDRSRGDYVLVRVNPGMMYVLHATGKIKLRQYMGQQVEVTGTQLPSLSTSSDAIAFGGSPAPVTIQINSIRTVANQCTAGGVN